MEMSVIHVCIKHVIHRYVHTVCEWHLVCTRLYEINVPCRYPPHLGIDTKGKNTVVCGRSKNVGMPLSILLSADSNTDTMAC